MKVLLLPINVASDISHKVRALRECGVDAKGIAFGSSVVQSSTDIKNFENSGYRSLAGIVNRLAYFREVYRLVKWADVIHWYWSFGRTKIEKHIIRWFNKPGVVQFCGSDSRIPEMDFAVNPYYKNAFDNGYEYAEFESRERSLSTQRDFADIGFYPLDFIGTDRYIDPRLFAHRFRVWQSVSLKELQPAFPDPLVARPLIVHSPTAPVAKGTEYVLAAVAKLRARYDIDFKLVEGLARDAALEIVKSCDIFVDQLILGGHGYAAVEAMAMGKPVVCYINPVIGKDFPIELPIVNANPDSIETVLKDLITNGPLRRELGERGRAYVEKHHSDETIARSLIDTYGTVIDLHAKKSHGPP